MAQGSRHLEGNERLLGESTTGKETWPTCLWIQKMNDLIEESLKIEKDFKNKIREALKGVNDEVKIETISIAGIEYFNAKLKFIIRFYEENKQIQQAFAEEKIDKEIENHRKRHVLDSFSEKEMDVLNSLIKNKETTTSTMLMKQNILG